MKIRLRALLVMLLVLGGASAGFAQTTLVFGVTSAPRTFNPWVTNDSASWTAMDMMYSGLTRLDAAGSPAPDLAESWEVSGDGLEYVFHLDPDARWHDGEPVTATDVKFTFEALLHPDTNSVWASRYTLIAGAKAYRAGDAQGVEGVEVVDEHTVRIALEAPLAPFLSYVSLQTPIMPSHLLSGVAPAQFEGNAFFDAPVGSGAYKFVRYESGQFVEYDAFESFHLGNPGFAKLFLRIGTTDTLLVQLQRGEVQVAPLNPHEVELVAAMPGVEVLSYPTSIVQAININLTRAPLQDVRVRQAIAYAIDRERLATIVLGEYGNVASSPLMAPDWVLTDDLTVYGFDLDKARALLQEAGWNASTHLTLRYPSGNRPREAAAAVIQQALAAAGIQVDLSISDFATLNADAAAGNFDLLLLGNQTIGDPDYIASQYTSYTAPPAGVNYMHYANPRVDELLEAGRTTADQAARYDLYRQFQQIVTEDLPKVFLYVDPEIYAVSDGLTGISPANGVGLLRSLYWNIFEWRPKGN